MRPSKLAVWRAMESEYADRLLEITMEHMSLLNKLPVRPTAFQRETGANDPMYENREVIAARIEQLRQERDSIIRQFEDVST